jgi:predicted pyridoxine 5'-phosphate oxidase superfamily flavin-nucleotide-binding protein
MSLHTYEFDNNTCHVFWLREDLFSKFFRINSDNLFIIFIFSYKENKLLKIVREERTCLYCNNNDVEDEMHILLKCPLYIIERKIFMDFIYNDNNQVASLQTKRQILLVFSYNF